MTQATTLSLRVPNKAVSDEQILAEMSMLLPGGVQNLVLAYAGDPTLLKTEGAFRVMWQACLEQAPLPRLVRVIDVVYSQDTLQVRVTTLFLTAMSFSSVPALKPQIDPICALCPEKTTPLGLVAPIMEKAQPTADQDLITVFNEIAKELKGELAVATFMDEIASFSPKEQASRISAFMPEIPELLAKITKLDLSNKKLSTLPSEIALLVNLQELYLGYNQLTQLPDAIFKLVNLQELNLYGNQLTQLPEAFSKLENLQELYLGNNLLTQLPGAISKMVKLRTLYLDGNQLTQQAKDALAPMRKRCCTVFT